MGCAKVVGQDKTGEEAGDSPGLGAGHLGGVGGGGVALGSESATSWVQILAPPFPTVRPQMSHLVSLCPCFLSYRVGWQED